MDKKSIVIISRTILPSQAPRSLRATELAKELARQGHYVTLFAVLGNYDYSVFEKTYNIKVNNIGKMRFATMNSDGKSNHGFFTKVLSKLFHFWFEFPDIELMFKIPSILKKGINIDLLITIAIPYPIHWGVALYKWRNKHNFPYTWVADCGDPYMGNQFSNRPFYFKFVEKWFCKKADHISVPTNKVINSYYPEFRSKIKVIPQGFKFEDIEYTKQSNKNSVPTFAYAGIFYKNYRDPSLFLNYLCSLKMKFKFIIYTIDDQLIRPYHIKLKNKIEVRSPIERKQLLSELTKMDFLLNIENINNWGSPSKLIDYALTKKPILSIPTNSLPIEVINEFLEGNYRNQFIVENIEQYNIKNVVNCFIKLIK